MKALLTSLSLAAALGISGPALAGPSDGTPSRVHVATDRLLEIENTNDSLTLYSVTDDRDEAVRYRWERKLKWVAGRRYRRSVLVRVPLELGNQVESQQAIEGRSEAVSYRWERKLKWVAGHRYRRSVLVRVPVE